MSAKKKAATEKKEPRVTGQVKIVALDEVKANDWNPNHMTPFMKGSLRRGFEEDGWVVSQALLIWGSDEKGRRKNIVIDGEHRLTVARELGFKTGPMVFLEKLTEAQAKALTVKMGKHGERDDDELGKLLRAVQFDLQAPDLGLSVGIEQDDLMRLLAEPAVTLSSPESSGVVPIVPPPDIPASGVRMVQLFFNEAQHKEFTRLIKELSPKFKTENITDAALEAVRRAHAVAFKSR